MLLTEVSFLLKALALLVICGEQVLVRGTGQNNTGELNGTNADFLDSQKTKLSMHAVVQHKRDKDIIYGYVNETPSFLLNSGGH